MASYAQKVYDNERGFVEMLGGVWREEDGVGSGLWHDIVVTRTSVIDAKTVRREFLLTARAAETIGDAGRFYTRGTAPGFVAIHSGRDPRPGLEARAGAAWGAAAHEMRDRGAVAAEGSSERVETLLGGATSSAPRRASLTSDGAGYVVVPEAKRARWKRLTDDELGGPDEAFWVKRGRLRFLALGTPDTVYTFPRPGGGARIVRVVSFDADDDDVLTNHVAAIDGTEFTALDGPLDANGPLVLLSAVVDGRNADTLRLDVPAGSYVVRHGTVAPDDGTELLVVDLCPK